MSKLVPVRNANWIPCIRGAADDLGLVAGCVYGLVALDCQRNTSTACFASHTKIGERLNVSERKVARALRKLCEKGYLSCETLLGRPDIYRDAGTGRFIRFVEERQ